MKGRFSAIRSENRQQNSFTKEKKVSANFSEVKKRSFADDSEYSDVDIVLENSDSEEQKEEKIQDMQDIDIQNFCKPLSVARYAEKIVLNDQSEEIKLLIEKGAFERTQKEVTPKMRSIVVRWLITIHDEFNFSNETLYNSIAYLDHYLAKYSIKKVYFQLLGAVCLWMAAKAEERSIPPISDFTDLCNKNYTKEQFCKLEADILICNDFRINFPTTKTFLRRFQCAICAERDRDILEVSSFLCECSLLSHEIACLRPSAVAFAIIAVTATSLKKECPIDVLLHYSHFDKLDEVKEATPLIIECATGVIAKKQGTTYQRYTGLHPDPSILRLDFDFAAEKIENY